MNKLCKQYKKLIFSKFGHLNPTIVFYGSNIYNASSSDLDVCVVTENPVCKEIAEQIISETIKFQKQNNLRVDEEIPFENKLLFSNYEIIDIFRNSPFVIDGEYKYLEIEKTKEFLSSSTMKKRLMLNILTTDHRVVGENKKIFKEYQRMAYKTIFDMLHNVFNTDISKSESIIKDIYINPHNGKTGEMYLGYKFLNKRKHHYLINNISKFCKKHIDKIDKPCYHDIVVDLDDTISDTASEIIEDAKDFHLTVLNRELKVKNIENCVDYFYFAHMMDWNKEDTTAFFKSRYPNYLRNVKLNEGVNEALNFLRQNHVIIHIVSARLLREEENVFELTNKWLNDNGVPFDTLDIGSKDKLASVKKFNTKIFIDDSIENCQIMQNEISGCKSIKFCTKFNNAIKDNQIEEARNWQEIKEKVITLLGGNKNE